MMLEDTIFDKTPFPFFIVHTYTHSIALDLPSAFVSLYYSTHQQEHGEAVQQISQHPDY